MPSRLTGPAPAAAVTASVAMKSPVRTTACLGMAPPFKAHVSGTRGPFSLGHCLEELFVTGFREGGRLHRARGADRSRRSACAAEGKSDHSEAGPDRLWRSPQEGLAVCFVRHASGCESRREHPTTSGSGVSLLIRASRRAVVATNGG